MPVMYPALPYTLLLCTYLYVFASPTDKTFPPQEKFEEAIKEFVDDWDRQHTSNQSVDVPTGVDDSNWTSPSSLTNCSRCFLHDEARNLRLEAIKVQILSKLGLKQAPNITRKVFPTIPPLHNLLDRYGMQSDAPSTAGQLNAGPEYADEDETESYHLSAEKVISFARDPLEHWAVPKELRSHYFPFTGSVLNSHVAKAHLWVYLRPNGGGLETTTAWIVVYQVVKGESGKTPSLLQVRTKKVEVNQRKGGWVTVEMRKLVAQWFRHPKDNMGIVIHSYDSEGRDLLVNEPHDSSSGRNPFMEVRVEKSHHKRTKRMIGLNCEENSSEVRCCRYPLTVDFEEFGWDWIIAPKRYEANYCSGECPYVFLQKYPHTHLVQQANPQGSAGPCCAPRKMSAISMLYFDESFNIIYGMLPGMVVDRCGCS